MEKLPDAEQPQIPEQFMSKDPFVILGVSDQASLDEIKQAQIRLIKQFHPDRSEHPDALEISKRINLAYDKAKLIISRRDTKTPSHKTSQSSEKPQPRPTVSPEKLRKIQEVREKFAISIARSFQLPLSSMIVDDIIQLVKIIDEKGIPREQIIDVEDIINRAKNHVIKTATNSFYGPAHFKQDLMEWRRLGFDLSDTINDERVSNYLYQTAITKSREHYPLNFTNFVEQWMSVGWKPSPRITELLKQKKNNKYPWTRSTN